MAIKNFSFLGYTLWVGEYDVPPSQKGQSFDQRKGQKSQNKLIMHDIRQQNKVRLRQMNTHIAHRRT